MGNTNTMFKQLKLLETVSGDMHAIRMYSNGAGKVHLLNAGFTTIFHFTNNEQFNHYVDFWVKKYKKNRRKIENKWIVNIKGKANARSFEICVVRENNYDGILSYGSFDKDKLLISHSGEPCKGHLTDYVWGKLVNLANDTAFHLNKEEQSS